VHGQGGAREERQRPSLTRPGQGDQVGQTLRRVGTVGGQDKALAAGDQLGGTGRPAGGVLPGVPRQVADGQGQAAAFGSVLAGVHRAQDIAGRVYFRNSRRVDGRNGC
jgi:hypothetical protein